MDTIFFWALIVAYSAHIMEEYFLDWKSWAQKMSGIKMEWGEFLIANSAVIVLGFCCAFVGFAYPLFSYLFVGLATVNAIFAHIGTSVVKKTFFPRIDNIGIALLAVMLLGLPYRISKIYPHNRADSR